MKKSAAKILGAAALGAAFAAVAAGSASAAPAVGLTDTLGSATGALQGLTSQQQVGEEGAQQSSDPTSQVTGVVGSLTSGLNGLGG
ncbi:MULTISPECIES: hypothetical protein [unclassified Streptomyces]|uniref:hypothetical protein n=1 Tax=unclassified Streptomyces TaxID=2593676 RepID=UPI00224E9645|nr:MULTISPECIES: hypothetical protein [unclassified Streptomyces]MCX4527696.1 hypothetical protein [Streptomyces sp. NBC_01551]MCX4541706.1 hypothetical protein [Streptomyces sp. NBC_01565]